MGAVDFSLFGVHARPDEGAIDEFRKWVCASATVGRVPEVMMRLHLLKIRRKDYEASDTEELRYSVRGGRLPRPF